MTLTQGFSNVIYTSLLVFLLIKTLGQAAMFAHCIFFKTQLNLMSCDSKQFTQYRSQNIRKKKLGQISILLSFMTLGAQTEWKKFLKMNNHIQVLDTLCGRECLEVRAGIF